MLRIMYIISARELKIAAIFIFFLSTYFCEFLKNKKLASKITLRRVIITRGTTQIADIKSTTLRSLSTSMH